MFRIQEEIAQFEEIQQLKKIQRTKDDEHGRAALEFARKRLDMARRELEHAEELRKNYEEAAEAFTGLIGRGGVSALERAGFEPGGRRRDRIADVITEEGFIPADALRSAGMTADEAERIAELSKAAEGSNDLKESLGGVASAMRSVTRMVDVFGDPSDETRQVADGVTDILDNIAEIDSGFLSGDAGGRGHVDVRAEPASARHAGSGQSGP